MEVTLIGASWDVVAGVQAGCGLHSYEAYLVIWFISPSLGPLSPVGRWGLVKCYSRPTRSSRPTSGAIGWGWRDEAAPLVGRCGTRVCTAGNDFA